MEERNVGKTGKVPNKTELASEDLTIELSEGATPTMDQTKLTNLTNSLIYGDSWLAAVT